MKKFYTACLLAAFAGIRAQSPQLQNQPLVPMEGIQRTCGTSVPPAEYENWVQTLYQAANNNGKGGGNQIQSVFNIPVIVHIVHNNEAVNSLTATSGGNLNAAQVIDQINILNKDFNGKNTDTNLIPAVFKPLMGKFQFNFCLAVVNPTGGILPEPGIDRINRVTKGWTAPPYTSTYVNNTIKPNSIWDPNRYLNMWVMSLGGGLLGYATFPNPGGTGLPGIPSPYGTATTDGVVMLNTAFGSIGTAANFAPYNKGRTTTHEIGHWVGLRHIWGDSNCGTDYCNDTPTQQGSNFGCPSFPKISCANGPNGEMHMNFMDYTDDACMYMFSKDQKYRAQLIMTGSPFRAALITSTVCNLPSVGHDIGITYVTSPTYSQVINCNNYITPVINLRNYGSTTLTSASVLFNVDGVNTQTVNWSGSLSPSTAVNFTLPQISNLVNGAHAFNATVTAPNGGTDNNSVNNVNNQLFSIANSFTLSASSATICTGQSATLVASGGATSYTWNPGAIVGATAVVSPTVSTTYTLSGSSGTCVNTRTTSVMVGSLNITTNNPSVCVGQAATLTASGANSYSWSNGANTASTVVSPAVTTIYTVTGSNGTCNGAKTATVSVYPSPTVAVNAATICAGSTATLAASGALTYSWNNGATTGSIAVSPLSTTVYTVTGYNGNCSNTKTVQVNVNPSPSVTVSNATMCPGGSVVLTASGAITYSWSNGANTASTSVSPSVSTVYTVTGSSNGCSNVKTATVTVIPFSASATSTNASCGGCNDGVATVTVSGGASPFTYNWMPAGGNSQTATGLSPGCYTVTIGSANGCSTTANTCVGSNTVTGIASLVGEQVKLYPNPTKENVTLEFRFAELRKIQVFDVSGRLISEDMLNAASVVLNLKALSTGMYYVKITGEHTLSTHRILKQ